MRYLSGVDRKLKQLSADRHFVVPSQMSLQELLQALLRAALQHEVMNLNSREADLEEIFLTYYRGDGTGPPSGDA